MLVKMSKIHIIGLKSYLLDVVGQLQEFGRLHLTDLREPIESGGLPVTSMVLFPRSQQQRDEMADLLVRGRALAQSLFGADEILASVDDTDLERSCRDHHALTSYIGDARAYIEGVEPNAACVVGRLDELTTQLGDLTQYEPLMEKIAPAVENLVVGREVDSIALLIEKRYRDAVTELRTALAEVSEGHTTLVTQELDQDMLAVIIIVDLEYARAVRDFLADEDASRVKLPGQLDLLPFAEALAEMRRLLEELPGQIEEVAEQVAALAEENRVDLSHVVHGLTNRIAQLDAIHQFGETEYTFLVGAYIPSEDLPRLRALVEERWADSVTIDEIDIDPHEYTEVPILLENTKRRRPFQTVLGVWGKPMYGTFDPSTILMYSFPFIWGMIVGDAGYGLLLVLLSLLARWRFPKSGAVKLATDLFLPAGLVAIVFGAFYYEFFGDLLHYLPIPTMEPIQLAPGFSLPFTRTSSAMQTTFLFMAIGVGVVEVIAGLILGIKTSRDLGHRKHVLMKSGLLTIMLSAIGMAALTALPSLTAGLPTPIADTIGYAVYVALALGFVITLWGGGLMGAIETIELFSHTASYIRIMAVGLVGAFLADAANALVFDTMPNLVGFTIAMVLHIINFILICFSPSIHALRLNFLEFFSKFWESGKVGYQPFVLTGKEGLS